MEGCVTTHGCCCDAIKALACAAESCIDQCAQHASDGNKKGCDDCASALDDTLSAMQKHLNCLKGSFRRIGATVAKK